MNRAGGLHPGLGWTLATAVVLGLLIWLLPRQKTPGGMTGEQPALVVYCAAGIQSPVQEVAREFEKLYGVKIQLQYGGSGTLLANLKVSKIGDLFIPGDESYITLGKQQGLLAEVLPLAHQVPVIIVRRGNPAKIQTVKDLLRTGIKVSLANPEAASIGTIVKRVLSASGDWAALEAQTRKSGVFKPTVNDVANDVKLGAVDAGVVWDATAQQYPALEMVRVPEFAQAGQTISVAVLNSTRQSALALRFARYLGARDKGLKAFTRWHYSVAEGDAWAEIPQITLFSGAMLRPGVEQTLKDFEQREGVRINTIYNGCGILTSQMRAGQRPDAYFACDTSFMKSVQDLYHDSVTISENEILIIVPKGNPQKIQTVEDLTKPGLRLGLAHPEKSAMGALTKNMLVAMGRYEAVCRNLKLDSPTGDFLINQLRTGSLDAIIACRSNAQNVREHVEVIRIDHPLATAVQPYGVAKSTQYQQLMTRLLEMIESPASSNRFTGAGFYWRFQARTN
ncbi:MAG: substrate-binding domain-containing protein [Verrucomicrobiota bacterium]